MTMSKEQLRQYLLLIIILAILTALAIVGMLQIFNAADEARHSVKVTQCQNVVLGNAVHQFHLSLAKIEEAESDTAEKARLIDEIQKEPDIALLMRACEKKP